MKGKGDTIKIEGKPYVLGEKVGSGQQGAVYRLDSRLDSGPPNDKFKPEDWVVKLIDDGNMPDARRVETVSHLRELKRFNVNKDLWRIMTLPAAILDDDVGYVMAYACDYESISNYIRIPECSFEEWYLNRSLKKRCQILAGLFEAVRTIHIHGLVFADLSPNNVLVHKKKNGVAFIDTENLVTRPDTVIDVLGTPGYIAPEILRKDVPESIGGKQCKELLSRYGRPTADSDVFSAAVIAFQVMTLKHPYIGDVIDEGTPEDETRAMNIETDFIMKNHTDNFCTTGLIPRYADVTTPRLRKLFERTFIDGKDNPYRRPTADEFIEAFQETEGLIISCPECGFPRLYSASNDNLCINCDRPITDLVALRMYEIFDDMNMADVINSMSDDSALDILASNLMDVDGNLPDTKCLISEVMLERGVPRKLYHHNFERTTERSSLYAKVTLSETSDTVRFEVSGKSPYPDAVCMKGNKRKKLESGQEFGLKDYDTVVFERKRFGKGTRTLMCKMEKLR